MFGRQPRLKVTLLIGCYNLGGTKNNNNGALPFPKQPQFFKFDVPNGYESKKGLIILIVPGRHFHGTENVIWAGLGPVGITKKEMGPIMGNF